MPARVPRLPAARRSEVFCVGAAGVGVLTPLYLMMPGADQTLARQTAKWAPRWERNISYFTPRAEQTIQRIEPPVARAVQKIDQRLPLERMAKGMERRIQKGIDRFGPKSKSG